MLQSTFAQVSTYLPTLVHSTQLSYGELRNKNVETDVTLTVLTEIKNSLLWQVSHLGHCRKLGTSFVTQTSAK